MNIRDKIEQKLTDIFPANLRPINKEAIPLITSLKDGNYGYSFLGLKTSTRPEDPTLPSSVFPDGLLYHNDKASFGIRIARYPANPEKICLICVAPRGRDWVSELDFFRTKVEEHFPDNLFFVRHLSHEDWKALGSPTNLGFIAQGKHDEPWQSMDFTPLENIDSSEEKYRVGDDQEYHHRLLSRRDIIKAEERGYKGYTGNITRPNRTRRKQTRKFFEDNNLTLDWKDLDEETVKEARALTALHFADPGVRSFYENIFRTAPEYLQQVNATCKVMYLCNENGRLPVGFYAAEPTGQDDEIVARYAGFSHMKEEHIKTIAEKALNHKDVLDRYFSWSFLQIMVEKYNNLKTIDFGGSETPGLEYFKEDTGCQKEISYWVASLESLRKASLVPNVVRNRLGR